MATEPTLGEYLLGVEGLALLRLASAADPGARTARIAEVRDLVGRVDTEPALDGSDAMLELAREKLPAATFRRGDLAALPLPDRSVDAVVCALALVHLPMLEPAMREFARVLRPGGHLVVSDVHGFLVLLAWQAQFRADDGTRGFMRLHPHLPSDYLRAATANGMALRSLEEPRLTHESVVTAAADVVPDANRAAYAGLPAVTIWDFELGG